MATPGVPYVSTERGTNVLASCPRSLYLWRLVWSRLLAAPNCSRDARRCDGAVGAITDRSVTVSSRMTSSTSPRCAFSSWLSMVIGVLISVATRFHCPWLQSHATSPAAWTATGCAFARPKRVRAQASMLCRYGLEPRAVHMLTV